MASFSPDIEKFDIKLRCKLNGHDGAPLIYLCTVPSCQEHLYCEHCMISEHLHHERSMKNYKLYLEEQVTSERNIRQTLNQNKVMMSVLSGNNNEVDAVKEDEENIIDELFLELGRVTKILIENTREKFKYNFKQHYNNIQTAIHDNMELQAKRDAYPTVKELIESTKPTDLTSCEKMFEILLKSPINGKSSAGQLEDQVKNIPRIDADRFEKVKQEVLQFIKEKMKGLLDFHVSPLFLLNSLPF
jgi:hypothetical protein